VYFAMQVPTASYSAVVYGQAQDAHKKYAFAVSAKQRTNALVKKVWFCGVWL
jgi:hypothetical protein